MGRYNNWVATFKLLPKLGYHGTVVLGENIKQTNSSNLLKVMMLGFPVTEMSESRLAQMYTGESWHFKYLIFKKNIVKRGLHNRYKSKMGCEGVYNVVSWLN